MTDEQLLEPHWLRLELRLDLASRREHESDDFGWDCWSGAIVAGWDTGDDPELDATLVRALADEFPRDVLAEDGEVSVQVGGCEFMVLRLDEAHPVFGEDVSVGAYGSAIYDAGDALSQDLADVLGPLTGGAGDDPFVEEVMDATEVGWYDSLVLLRSIGIHEMFRDQGIGAWTAARGIAQLAPTETALVALKAAPLNRSKFLASIGIADPDSHRDLTPVEIAAWDAACERIAANWKQGLGLTALAGHPGVLYGPGGMNAALTETLQERAG